MVQGELLFSLGVLYGDSDLNLDKLLLLIREVAIKAVPEKLFAHLLFITQVKGDTFNFAKQVKIYESKLACSQFAADEETWLAYFAMLRDGKTSQLEAQAVLKRALKVVVKKERLMLSNI